MSITILGICQECDQEKPVEIKAYPHVAEPPVRIMVQVVANCTECGSTLAWTWAHLPDLRPDWTEFEKAKALLEGESKEQ